MASNPAHRRGDSARPRGGGGFALLSNAFLDELRARTTLSTLVGRTTKLQKAGAEWKAPCPFHNEKTPSFYVNDAKAFYHCFGCGAHGDAIRWMTEQRGLPFMDAVKELADAAGMELPRPSPEQRERAERQASLHEVVAAAEAWFRQQLGGPAGAAARAYLDGRGIARETLAEFAMGYAPGGRTALAKALEAQGADRLVEAGLLIAPEGGGDPYDRMRDRAIIPIHDARGRPIAFGGRAMGDAEPKYLNSPETPLFDKGSTLFNLHRAAPASRKSGRLIVVEGYLDAIALAQAGVREAVAPLGTALTERQMERAWSLVDVPILCLDGDAAGQKAALRAAERALPVLRPGKSLAFATLPAGMDPDDLIRSHGLQAFEDAIAVPRSLVRILYEREAAAGDMAQPEQRAGLRARLEALAESCADRVVAQEYRRSFNDLFYEDFGWKKADRKVIRAAALNTVPERPGDVGSSIMRSALQGMTQFPAVLLDNVDALHCWRVEDRRLAGWRDDLVRQAEAGATMHGAGQLAIIVSDGLREIANAQLGRDLRFPFNDPRVPEDRQVAVLRGLVRFLCEERELDEGLSGLDRAALTAATEDEYLAIEAERQYLRSERGSLYDWAYELGAGSQEHGIGNGEDEHGGSGDGRAGG